MTEDLRERIRKIAEKVAEKISEKLGIPSQFTLDGNDPVEPKGDSSPTWYIRVWHKSTGRCCEIMADENTPTEKLRENIEEAMWEQVQTISELADRLKES